MATGHVDKTKPLKPLSAHAWRMLAWLAEEAVASHLINPGVHDRFRREGLAHTDGGRTTITEAGREKLKERP